MKKAILPLTVLLFILFAGCEQKDPVPSGEGKALVLMYHRIVEGDPSNLYERRVSDLEDDLKYLRDKEIRIINFDELSEYAAGSRIPDGNVAILTFDDGDNSWYSLVKPLLIKYNAKATFFLWTYMMDRDSFLTWDEVASMSHYYNGNREYPFTFGSHTFSHAWLKNSKENFSSPGEYNSFLDYELGVSKSMIEEHTPYIVSILSLPYGNGASDPDIISAAKRNGYSFIRTSVWNSVDLNDIDPYAIPSLPILDSTTQEEIGYYFE